MKVTITTLAVAAMVAPQVLAAPVPTPGLSEWATYAKSFFTSEPAPALTESKKLEPAKAISEDYDYILEAPKTEEEIAALKELGLQKLAAQKHAQEARKQKIKSDPQAFRAIENKAHAGFSLAELVNPTEQKRVYQDYEFIPEVRKEMLKKKLAAEEAQRQERIQKLQAQDKEQAMKYMEYIHGGFQQNTDSKW